MKAADRVPIGGTGLTVPRLGIGTAAFGGLYRAVPESDVHAVVDEAMTRGLGYFDTAPLYGHGTAERRLGAALAGVSRADFVVSTKVGRLLAPNAETGAGLFADAAQGAPVFDFSAEGVRRSLVESLDRLGMDRVDIALIHDPDDDADQAVAESYPVLDTWRAEGVVRAIGVGVNHVDIASRFVRDTDVDVVLLAGRYTLLDQSAAEEFLPLCVERGVSVIIGGVFNSGILADPSPGARYDYREAPPALVERARAMRDICAEHEVPLTAAALQFPFRHPAVASVLTGVRNRSELEANLTGVECPIPDDLLAET